jgi:tetratricopeptide (TPR) repeat protein
MAKTDDKSQLLAKYLEWISFNIENKSWNDAEILTKEALSKLGEDFTLLKRLKTIYKNTSSENLEPTYLRLGKAYKAMGKFDKYQKVYGKIWQKFENIKAGFSLASSFMKKGISLEALEIFKKLLEILFLKGNI